MGNNITIIGGGPGGYIAAIRAAQLGAQVTLIEKDSLGGTCLNRGCIPTKVLLQSADTLAEIRNASTFGISVDGVSVDFSAVMKRKNAVIRQLQNGVASLMKKNKIRVVEGVGTLIDSRVVGQVGKPELIRADSIIIATGAKAAALPIAGINEPGVMTSDEALSMDHLPKSVIVIGGGVIGVELAQVMQRLGAKVTVLEAMPQILPNEDKETASMLEGLLKGEGIDIFTGVSVIAIRNAKDGKQVSYKAKSGTEERQCTAERVLVCVGRRPNTDSLGADRLGLAQDGRRLVVNERMETNVPGVYAVGDVTGKLMLAHVAMAEGVCAAENATGNANTMNYKAVPRGVYTSPEVASVGLNEQQARKDNGDIKVGRFPFVASGKASVLNQASGMVKIVADAAYGQILGVTIVGPHATELIAEAVLAIRMEATVDDLVSTIHAHPTLSEAMMEAALNLQGRAIHL